MYKFTLLVTTPRPHRAPPACSSGGSRRTRTRCPPPGPPSARTAARAAGRSGQGQTKYKIHPHNSCLLCVSVTSHEPRGPSTSTWCTMSWRRVVALKYWPPITMSTLSQLQEQCEAWHGTPASPGTGDQPDQGQEGGPELHAGPLHSHCTQIQHICRTSAHCQGHASL